MPGIDMVLDPIGKIVFDGYRIYMDELEVNCLYWEDLDPVEQEAWNAAAVALMLHFDVKLKEGNILS